MLKKPEFIFAIFGLIFGIAILFITPKFGVADETAHYLRAEEVSQGKFYNNVPENRNDSYKFHGASGYSPIMYTFSGTALKLTRNFDENIQFYSGRIANLIVWILLISIAIHITPVFKWAFFITALFPMSIYEGMSYSADSFSNAFAFLFFAYMFKLIFNKKEFSCKKDLPLLTIFTITGALCKGIMFPLFLLPFVPVKRKYLLTIILLLLALTTSCLWSSHNYTAITPGGDYELNKSFIQQYPIQFLQIFCHTYFTNGIHLFGQAIAKLGWQCIKLHSGIYALITLVFFSSLIFIPEKFTIKPSYRISAFLIFTLYTISLSCLMFCMCHRQFDTIIMGIQGRYFISVIPLIFMMFANNKTILNGKIEKYMPAIIVQSTFWVLIDTCFVLYDTLKLGPQFFFPS